MWTIEELESRDKERSLLRRAGAEAFRNNFKYRPPPRTTGGRGEGRAALGGRGVALGGVAGARAAPPSPGLFASAPFSRAERAPDLRSSAGAPAAPRRDSAVVSRKGKKKFLGVTEEFHLLPLESRDVTRTLGTASSRRQKEVIPQAPAPPPLEVRLRYRRDGRPESFFWVAEEHASTVLELFANGKLPDAMLIDTRIEQDFNTSHLRGAISKPRLGGKWPVVSHEIRAKQKGVVLVYGRGGSQGGSLGHEIAALIGQAFVGPRPTLSSVLPSLDSVREVAGVAADPAKVAWKDRIVKDKNCFFDIMQRGRVLVMEGGFEAIAKSCPHLLERGPVDGIAVVPKACLPSGKGDQADPPSHSDKRLFPKAVGGKFMGKGGLNLVAGVCPFIKPPVVVSSTGVVPNGEKVLSAVADVVPSSTRPSSSSSVEKSSTPNCPGRTMTVQYRHGPPRTIPSADEEVRGIEEDAKRRKTTGSLANGSLAGAPPPIAGAGMASGPSTTTHHGVIVGTSGAASSSSPRGAFISVGPPPVGVLLNNISHVGPPRPGATTTFGATSFGGGGRRPPPAAKGAQAPPKAPAAVPPPKKYTKEIRTKPLPPPTGDIVVERLVGPIDKKSILCELILTQLEDAFDCKLSDILDDLNYDPFETSML